MPNLPGFDFAEFVVKTYGGALASQLQLWNKAWGDIESGNFEFKSLLQAWAKSHRLNCEALREIATFDTKSVEWQQIALRDGERKHVSFSLPSSVRSENVTVSRVDAIGEARGGRVGVAEGHDEGIFSIDITAQGGVVAGDQYIAFAYDAKNGGQPLGVVLIVIVAV